MIVILVSFCKKWMDSITEQKDKEQEGHHGPVMLT